jgi:hypothetical protein
MEVCAHCSRLYRAACGPEYLLVIETKENDSAYNFWRLVLPFVGGRRLAADENH